MIPPREKAKDREKKKTIVCDLVVIELIWYNEEILGGKIGVQQEAFDSIPMSYAELLPVLIQKKVGSDHATPW